MIDKAVIDNCIKGKRGAQKTLYRAYAKKMFLISYRYVNQKEDAEEIVSEGFIKIFLNLPKLEYRNLPMLEAWMRKIIVNESLMFLRKNQKIFGDESEYKKVGAAPEIESRLDAQALYKMVLDLPHGYRTVFNLYALEGYSHKEISQKLDISESTSRSQLAKARKLLKQRISKSDL
ncbi:MAG: sigma-70 family RNA polymerase sigma factor [Bacteroidota bacterium]|nr:sigma-70 family RNA polymerase sigma factor [uncultured Allomuricauda sp.]